MLSLLIRRLVRAFSRSKVSVSPNAPGQNSLAEDQVLELASEAIRRLDLKRGIALLRPVMEHARHAKVPAMLAHCLVYTGAPQEARQILETALARHPEEEDLFKVQATLFEHLGDPAGAYKAHFARLKCTHAPQAPMAIALLKAFLQIDKSELPSPAGIELAVATFNRIEADATPRDCDEFAELLFMIAGYRLHALKIRQRHSNLGALTELRWINHKELLLAGLATAPCQPNTAPPPPCLIIRSASVLPGVQWAPYLPERGLIVAGFTTRRLRTHREEVDSSVVLHDKEQVMVDWQPQDIRHIDEPTVLIGGTDNYYHFVLEHLGRMASLDQLPLDRGQLRWLLPSDLKKYQRDYLMLLGISEDRWLLQPPGVVYRFDQLIAPLPLVRGSKHIHPLVPRWLRHALAPHPTVPANRRLFLPRSSELLRTVLNEQEVSTLLEQHGFEIIRPETLSVAEQIALFAQASAVVAPSGAALTNMVYMPPGGTVIVLYSAFTLASPAPLYFDELARACGHDFHPVSGTTDSFRTERAVDADFSVDLNMLNTQLMALPRTPT